MRMTSASSRGQAMMSADLPCSCAFRIGEYQKKSRERRRTVWASLTSGTGPLEPPCMSDTNPAMSWVAAAPDGMGVAMFI